MKKPYPGYPPSYSKIDGTGGLTRTCFVLEFLSLGHLSKEQRAMIEEQISALVEKLARGIITVEKTDFVTPDRFDQKLSDGLRLSSVR